jgi:hypothetical protein
MNMPLKAKTIDTRYKAFNEKWFLKHQPVLLHLLNNKHTASFFRNIFNIRMEKDIPLVSIMPNHFKIFLGKDEYMASFYHHDFFSKIVYSRMKYIWRAIHEWDTKIANRFFPSLNLGLDELEPTFEIVSQGTASIGNIEVLGQTNVLTWDDLRYGDGDNGGFESLVGLLVGIEQSEFEHTENYKNSQRAIISYNTSYLGSNIKVTNAVISPDLVTLNPWPTPLYGSPHLSLVAHSKVTSYALEDNSVTSDDYTYVKFGTVEFAALSWQWYVDNSHVYPYYNFVLNQAGRDYVHSKRYSHCAFGFRLSCDLLNEEPRDFVSKAHSLYQFNFNDNTTFNITYYANPQRIVMMQ